jgi:hypothetical protein
MSEEGYEMPGLRDRSSTAVAIEGLFESGTLTSLTDDDLL